VTSDLAFGAVYGLDRVLLVVLFGVRGGDPDRAGKKDPLDCVLWRAERPDEPAWDSPFGRGRPGWHIECSAIALEYLGQEFDVQAGGTDLIFPHHEMSAGEVQVAHPGSRFAKAYAHQGMVGYDGEKMSKSKGNLVFVSALRNSDVDPMAIRLTLLRHHYRTDWEWTDDQLWSAVDTLDSWRMTLTSGAGAAAAPVVAAVLEALANDLDAPAALAAVDGWVAATNAGDSSDGDAAATIASVLDAALGLVL
jgi:L-cysteine:1D-myo-inositol 2-amino-2-deoxy-alpha-D-glucopyranoside ligase